MYKYIRKTFYEDDDCKVVLEEGDGNLMAHVGIFHATPSVMKRIQKIWKVICESAYWQGYENIFTYTKDTRIMNFIKGGEITGDFESNGETYKVIKWDLK